MTEGNGTLAIAGEEQLARFILYSKWIRSSNQTARPEAFIPHPYPDLSVTRHLNLSEEALWKTGQNVADARPATLYGRADIYASSAKRQSLKIAPNPVPNNPNHANIVGWPADKPAQKIIALELAANSDYWPK